MLTITFLLMEKEKREKKNRKITKKDIEELKKAGIDHWMFDEMDFKKH